MGVRARNILAFIANLTVFVATAICVATFFLAGGVGNMQVTGWAAFRYFTVDSNVLAALGCLVGLSCNMVGVITGEDYLPRWALLFRFAGTVAVTLTLVVVAAFLGFVYGFEMMFTGINLFLHGINPALCILTFMFLDKGLVRFREVWIPLVPVLAYGVVYVLMVVYRGVAAGGWPDFYQFNTFVTWPVSVLVAAVATFLIAAIERLPHRWVPKQTHRRSARPAAADTTALARTRRVKGEEGETLARLRRPHADEAGEQQTDITPEP